MSMTYREVIAFHFTHRNGPNARFHRPIVRRIIREVRAQLISG